MSFTVAKSGKQLTGFRYETFGCFGSGGFKKGNPWKNEPAAVQKTGTISLKHGHFSVSGVKSTYSDQTGFKTVTTSTVSVSFKSSHSASGKISYSQRESNGGHCGPVPLTFSAKAK